MNTLDELRHEVTRRGTVRRLAEEVGRVLRAGLPTLRKAVVDKVALAVGAMIEGRPRTRRNWPISCRRTPTGKTCASSGRAGC